MCGAASLSDRVSGNVLSLGRLRRDGYKVDYLPHSNRFRVSGNKSTAYFSMRPDFIYTNRGNLVRRNTSKNDGDVADLGTSLPALMGTASEEETLFTPRQVNSARQALKLTRRLGYPSMRAARDAVASGSIQNCGVSVRDTNRCVALWGLALPALKGRMTGHKLPERRKDCQGYRHATLTRAAIS
ncbi:hypothetical protein FVE85_8840 [Porphyridium purpureum]|uniref:Uncharacterized protein n=1 Tax=Porphyridium purpureum TaxID=35688 RepID=A0A5J4YQ92_PORPP|nr:hypothetical protein FVE85_8840 [Porphyridium purpureum]|eukprot:POR0876..scf296_7